MTQMIRPTAPNRPSGASVAIVAALLWAVFPSPASAGWLDNLAVGETHRLEPGTFYHKVRKAPPAAGQRVAVLPVGLDRELAASFEYADRARVFTPIGDAVQARLATTEGLRVVEATALPKDGAPRVYVGSATGDLAPPDAEQSASAPGDLLPPMVLHLERPSKAWQDAARKFMAAEGLTHLIVVNVAVSQYPKEQRGLTKKAVLLGTGYAAPVKFLTAVDKPIEVLQVTGLLVDADGRVLRAGAEGVLGRDTPFTAQIFDISKVLDDEALQAALTAERRHDLTEAPLALEVAVDNLVAQLLQDSRRLRMPLP
jgi:hypothetical protein